MKVINNSKFGLWPEEKNLLNHPFFSKKVSTEDVEDLVKEKFKNNNVVLMPSGRSSISILLEYLRSKRDNKILIPPFASHCVLNAISLHSTPTQTFDKSNFASLIFHQWGFEIKCNLTGIKIEDSVDSIVINKNSYFPNDGDFEVFSLPKIVGSFIGGVILCKNKNDVQKIKKIRDDRNLLGSLHYYLKFFFRNQTSIYHYVNYVEPHNGYLPNLALKDIFYKIKNIDNVIEKRLERIQNLKKAKIPIARDLPNNRLISSWPLPFSEKFDKKIKSYGFYLGKRHFVDIVDNKFLLKEVLPLPLHYQVSDKNFKLLINDFNKLKNSA